MKRDFDKIRQVLLDLENSEDGLLIHNDDKLDQTAKLLSQAGFIACYIPGEKVSDLTWAGQDFIEIVRDDKRWSDIKAYIKQEHLPLVLDNIVAVAKEKFVLKKATDQEQDADEIKEKIIKSATKIFSQKRYANTTMLEIANDAGVSRGPLYYYFKTKADLFRAVIREYSSNMFKGNLDISENEPTIDNIRCLVNINLARIFEYNENNLMSDLFLHEEFKEEAQLIRSHTEAVYNILVKGGEDLVKKQKLPLDFTPRELAGMTLICYYGVRGLVANDYLSAPVYHLKKNEIKDIVEKTLKLVLGLVNLD